MKNQICLKHGYDVLLFLHGQVKIFVEIHHFQSEKGQL